MNRMKKNFIFRMTIFSVIVLSFFVLSCNTKTDSKFTTKVIKWKQEIKQEKLTAECQILADYPDKGNPLLLRGIREWMNEQLGGIYTGDLNTGDSVVAYYGKMEIDSLKSQLEVLGDSEYDTGLDNDRTLRLVYETNRFVTYGDTSYIYSGGAHGSQTIIGATFRKDDGRKFGWDMLINTNEQGFHDLLREGLKRFFKVVTDQELKDNLMLENEFAFTYFPLPQTPPYIGEDGMHFIYQQYEIACYAAGHPEAVIPFSELTPYLTVTVSDLLKP